MKTKYLKSSLLLLLLAMAMGMPLAVYASDTDNATYTGTIRITNNGTGLVNNVAVPFTLDTDYLIDNLYISDNCMNTAIVTNTGGDTSYMPAQSGSTTWIVYVPSIPGNAYLDYTLYVGGSNDMAGDIVIFGQNNGYAFTRNDHADLELTTNGEVLIDGYFVLTGGLSNTMVFRGSGITLTNSAANVLSGTDGSGNTVTTGALASGDHIARYGVNATGSYIYYNGSLEDTDPAGNFNQNSNPYNFGDNDGGAITSGMLYIREVNWIKSGTLTANWTWDNDTAGTLQDKENNYDTNAFTPRTTTSSANISAELISFSPVSEAEIDSFTLSQTGNWTTLPTQPTTLYTEGTIAIPGASALNDIMALSNIPPAIFWFPLALLFVIGVGWLCMKISHGNLFVKSWGQFLALLFVVAINIFGGWTLLIFTMFVLPLNVLAKHYSW